jgi:N-acylglucosamine-6-phosphate 2-epimerase
MIRQSVLPQLRGQLIVSCQAYPGEPLRDPRTMEQMVRAVVAGGAAGVRVQGIADTQLISASVTVPVIGLWKTDHDDVFITPTLAHAVAVAEAGADIVAIDGTQRARPDNLTLAETVARFRERTSALIMADCGYLDDALAAERAGVDILATTLSGYTGERPRRSCEVRSRCASVRRSPIPRRSRPGSGTQW